MHAAFGSRHFDKHDSSSSLTLRHTTHSRAVDSSAMCFHRGVFAGYLNHATLKHFHTPMLPQPPLQDNVINSSIRRNDNPNIITTAVSLSIVIEIYRSSDPVGIEARQRDFANMKFGLHTWSRKCFGENEPLEDINVTENNCVR